MWFIYLPLKQIRLAAMEYAKGNFEYEGLKVNNDDEIGDVAHSLQYMSKQLNNSRAYQKEFISNISHDFRSPLTSIKGYIEAIMDGTIPRKIITNIFQLFYLRLTVSKSLLQDCVTLTVGTALVLNLFLKTLIWNQLSLQQLILSRAVARRRILNWLFSFHQSTAMYTLTKARLNRFFTTYLITPLSSVIRVQRL